jgi:glycosyltransferase involved in cell wall biosynthesis
MLKYNVGTSIIVTAHNEGIMLEHCIRMIYRNTREIKDAYSFSFEILIALDNPNYETNKVAEFLQGINENIQIFRFNHGDVGLVRSKMIDHCNFNNVFFVDADDLWSKNWLQKVLSKRNIPLKKIYHPELTYFKMEHEIKVLKNFKSNKLSSKKWSLLFENLWSSSFAINKDTFLISRFKSGGLNSESKIHAFEDWTFFRDSCYSGIQHQIISGTFHLHRQKEMSNTSLSTNKLPHPVIFDVKLFRYSIKQIPVANLSERAL